MGLSENKDWWNSECCDNVALCEVLVIYARGLVLYKVNEFDLISFGLQIHSKW